MQTKLFLVFALVLCNAVYNYGKIGKKVNSDLNCQLCEVIVAIVEQLVPAGETPDEIVKTLEKLCAALPAYQLECKIIVDTYGKKIITEIVNKAPPQNVCRDLTLCPKNMSSFSAITPKKEKEITTVAAIAPIAPVVKKHSNPNKPNTIQCEICKLVLSEVEKYITENSTEQQIEKALEQVCKSLPKAVQAICVAFVQQYEAQIVELLIKQLPPEQVCAAIGLCKQQNPVNVIPYVKKTTTKKFNSDLTCEVCQYVLGEIEKYIQQNSTEQHIIAVVEKICSTLPSPYAGICKTFIDSQGIQIINALIAKHPPKQVCTQIGICKNTTTVVKPKVGDDIACAVCKYILGEIEKYITENSSVAHIVSTVEKICTLLPLKLQKMCDTFIEEYGPMIVTYLVTKHPAKEICEAMGTCPPTITHKKVINPKSKSKPDSIICTVCEFIIKEVEKLLSANSTEQQIIDAVEKVCFKLPKSYADMCKAFVDEYGPEVIQLLLNKYPPDMICKTIGLCTQRQKKVKTTPKVSDSVVCAACKYILTEVDKYLSDNATEKEIVKVIEHICNLLPLKIQDVCDAFIEEYGEMVINLLINKYPPEQVCDAVHFCKKENKIVLTKLRYGKAPIH